MPRETAPIKAQRLLLAGAVRIREVNPTTVVIRATVTGDTGMHNVMFTETNGWTCDCRAYSWRCSHVRAVETVRPAEQADSRKRHLSAVPEGAAG